jgi:hypothetical protein
MIKFLINNKWSILFILIIGIIVFLPIMINGNNFLIINNDTAAHLKVFESMKIQDTNTLYFGQKITGYFLIFLEDITGVNIQILFMIFNFTCLFISGLIIMLMVYLLTKNKMASLISLPLIIFGIGSTQHLFKSGTIFNLIEYLILLPILIITINYAFTKRNIISLITIIILGILIYAFHTSVFSINYIGNVLPNMEGKIGVIESLLNLLGFSNIIGILLCIYLCFKNRYIDIRNFVIVCTLTFVSAIMYILDIISITPFSSRLAINASLLIGITFCIWIGMTLKNNYGRVSTCLVITLVAIGIVPNLINWFGWISLYNPNRGSF